jgi:hypothetical protein
LVALSIKSQDIKIQKRFLLFVDNPFHGSIMAIPLRLLASSDPDTRPPRASMDSEASAILSYALGKHADNEDQDSEIDSPRASSTYLSDGGDDSDAFFKENDPLTSDYEPFPRKQVIPLPSLFSLLSMRLKS